MSALASPRDRTIVALARQGVRPGEIAGRLDPPVRPMTVYGVLTRARAAGEDLPKFATNAPRGALAPRVAVDRDVLLGLAPHAERRGLTPAELARTLLAHAVRGGLVDAIMDDGDDGEGGA